MDIEQIKADCEASMKKTGMIGPGLYEELLAYIERLTTERDNFAKHLVHPGVPIKGEVS